MIGAYGRNKMLEVTTAAIKKPGAEEDLMIAHDYEMATTKPTDPDYFKKREAAIRRAYLRRERKRLAAERGAVEVVSPSKPNYLPLVLILGVAAVGIYYFILRKKG